MKVIVKISLLLIALSVATAHAHSTAAEDEQSVAKEMHETWDKPGQPLKLPVIVIHHGMAIADWIQGDKGGRALLKYHPEHQHWHTLLCGGAELTASRHLQEAGMSTADAQSLVLLLQQREQVLPEDQRKQINSFSGVVNFSKGKPVPSVGHEMHGEAHGH